MTDTVSALDLPHDEAIRFFRDKASVTTAAWTDVYAAAHSRMFMVAGAATEALVSDFRLAVDQGLANGTTLEEFRKSFDQIVERHGWDYKGTRNWRTRIIFETNLRTAYAAGRYKALSEPDTLDVFPYWQYHHSGSTHPRPEHLSWDGMVLRADDPFWITNYPPNGWRCGCFVTPVSQAGLRRQGKSGPDASPDLVFRAEEVGGNTVRVPQGVDPGFEYNPGMTWLSRTTPGSQTVAAAPGRIAQFVDGAIRNDWPGKSYIPVARTPDILAEAVNVPAQTEIRLSVDTIRSHLKHSQITSQLYAKLPEWIVDTGALYERPDGRLLVSGYHDGVPYTAALKIVRHTNSAEIYLLSLRRTNPKQLAQIERTAKLIMKNGKHAGGPELPSQNP